jgi:hypothetical protein
VLDAVHPGGGTQLDGGQRVRVRGDGEAADRPAQLFDTGGLATQPPAVPPAPR